MAIMKNNKGKLKKESEQDKFSEKGKDWAGKSKTDEDDEIIDKEDKESDTDVYSEKTDERLLDEDEMNPGDAGFLEGYAEPKLIQCRNKCDENVDVENPVVRDIKGKEHYFCSEECANEFARKGHGKKKD
ncbi:MAG: hypothetical protein Q7S92_02800 [Candidatus Diapherotrites archaeon]|nr:hypothetical protein [Candidatus Diapherotrites archaeon]